MCVTGGRPSRKHRFIFVRIIINSFVMYNLFIHLMYRKLLRLSALLSQNNHHVNKQRNKNKPKSITTVGNNNSLNSSLAGGLAMPPSKALPNSPQVHPPRTARGDSCRGRATCILRRLRTRSDRRQLVCARRRFCEDQQANRSCDLQLPVCRGSGLAHRSLLFSQADRGTCGRARDQTYSTDPASSARTDGGFL